MQLFRQQAIDHQNRLFGEVMLVPPVRWWGIAALFLCLGATAALFLLLGTYSPTFAANGVIQSQDVATLRVSARDRAHVRQGQSVRMTLADPPLGESGSLSGVIAQVDPHPSGGDPAYIRVLVRLMPPSSGQRGLLPRAGAALDARIILARRSLLEWLIEPAGAAVRP